MAIVTEHFLVGERDSIRTWSDKGNLVERDGVLYEVAEDPAEFNRTYTETDIPIGGDADEDADKAEAFDILMGESE